MRFLVKSLILALLAAPPVWAQAAQGEDEGLAILAKKALVCSAEKGADAINRAVILVKDGLIEAIGPRSEVSIPVGYRVRDLGDQWVMPGMIDLHNHASGLFELNDVVYLTQPGLRASPCVLPGFYANKRAVAGGVTTVLYIPGSGVNIGGQGVLLKTGVDHYEDHLVRDPGSMKLAQSGNPEGWTVGVGRSFMNWNTRHTLKRGLAYAKRWKDYEEGRGEKPEVDPQWEVFRDLANKEIAISVHTQIYQVVLMTITMLRLELGFEAFLDHGSVGAWRLGGIAQEAGVPAIVGPRTWDIPFRSYIGWGGLTDEGFKGLHAGYQEMGHEMLGFNTDSLPMGAFTIPQEQLFLLAALAVKYGMDTSDMQAVKGLTIVPAMTAGIDHLVGSLEVGKHADILALDGNPLDPRTSVHSAWIEGELVYDIERDDRRF